MPDIAQFRALPPMQQRILLLLDELTQGGDLYVEERRIYLHASTHAYGHLQDLATAGLVEHYDRPAVPTPIREWRLTPAGHERVTRYLDALRASSQGGQPT